MARGPDGVRPVFGLSDILLDMSRPLRIEYPGAFYHVTSRGNARKNIFLTDEDREQFLFLLAKTIKKHNWRCHTFCLMDNHYHLIIETVDPTLSNGMQDLNGNYTQWFNAKHESVGHIFQGRFKAFLIEEHSYLLNVMRYVVLNPVRANMVISPADYHWSSYRSLAGLEKTPDWLTTSNILNQFSSNKKEAHRQYQKFIMDGISLPSPMLDAKNGGILGTEQFISEMRGRIEAKNLKNDIVVVQKMAGRPTLEKLFDDVKDIQERNAAITLALFHLQYSGAEVGRFLGMNQSYVRKVAKKMM